MGTREVILFIIVFYSFTPASLGFTRKNKSSGHLQENSKKEEIGGHESSSLNGDRYISNQSKFAHGSGVASRQPGGNTGDGNTPNVQGGSAVIPIYAGGAANNRNRHGRSHSGAHSHCSRAEFALLAATISSVLIYLERVLS